MILLLVISRSALERGMNTGLENLAWGLAGKGIIVHILAGGGAPLHKKRYSIPKGVFYHFTGKPLNTPADFVPHFRNIVSEIEIDIVVGWLENIALLAHDVSRSSNLKFIANEGRLARRSVFATSAKYVIRRQMSFLKYGSYIKALWRLDRTIDHVVGISNTVCENVRRFYHLRQTSTSVIYRGVDTKVFFPSRVRNKDEVLRLMFAGNVLPGKGVSDLIDSVKLLPENRCVEVNLCGEVSSEYRKYLLAEVQQHSNIKVLFHGILTPFELALLYNRTDAFVFCSYSEGLGKVLLEAMATGCVVICSDIDSFQEVVVPGQNGLMVPLGAPEKIADCIRLISEYPHKAERIGDAAASLVAKKFSTENEVGRWLTLIEKLIRDNHIR